MVRKRIKKNIRPYLLEHGYAVGLTLGLLYGWYAQDKVIGFLVVIWFLAIVERLFIR